MTLTHISHYELTETGETETYKLFKGSKAACLRILYAHGCELFVKQSTYNSESYKDQDGRISSITELEPNVWGMYIRKETWNNS